MLGSMAAATSLIHIDGDRLDIPRSAFEHDGFRAWLKSDDFPDGVRATYVLGEVFCEMSPESIETHNKVKAGVTIDLGNLVRAEALGEIFLDGVLLTHEGAGLSTEPDLIFATWDAFTSGRLRMVEKRNREGDYIELVGTPDLVVEIVSDSSVRKDLVALRSAYFKAEIPEYWLVDARGDDVRFEILARTPEGYVARATSVVFGRSFRLERVKNRAGRWDYRLISAS